MTTDTIVPRGIGSYLDAPTFPTHSYSVAYGPQRSNKDNASLTYAIECEYIDAAVREAARAMIQRWRDNKPALESPEIQEWIKACWTHWNRCYLPKGERDIVVMATDTWEVRAYHWPWIPPMFASLEFHYAVIHIRKFYSEYIPA